MTLTHDALDFTVQAPPPQTSDLEPAGPHPDIRLGTLLPPPCHPLLVTSGGRDWRPVHLRTLPPPEIDIWWWLLKLVQSAQACFLVIIMVELRINITYSSASLAPMNMYWEHWKGSVLANAMKRCIKKCTKSLDSWRKKTGITYTLILFFDIPFQQEMLRTGYSSLCDNDVHVFPLTADKDE